MLRIEHFWSFQIWCSNGVALVSVLLVSRKAEKMLGDPNYLRKAKESDRPPDKIQPPFVSGVGKNVFQALENNFRKNSMGWRFGRRIDVQGGQMNHTTVLYWLSCYSAD